MRMAEDELVIEGVCKCGGETWNWRLDDTELTLTCTACKQEAHWGVMFPMMDLFSDAFGGGDNGQS